MLVPLIERDPVFAATYALRSPHSPERERHHLGLAWLAAQLASQCQENTTERFQDIFGLVEGWYAHGDMDVTDAVSGTFIEMLKAQSHVRGLDEKVWIRWLGRRALEQWERSNRYWASNGGDGKLFD